MLSMNLCHKNVTVLFSTMNPEPGKCLVHSRYLINEGSLLSTEPVQGALDGLDDGWNQIKVALRNSPVLHTPLDKTFLMLLNIFLTQNCWILAPKSPFLSSVSPLLLAELSAASFVLSLPLLHTSTKPSHTTMTGFCAAWACTVFSHQSFRKARAVICYLFPDPMKVWRMAYGSLR